MEVAETEELYNNPIHPYTKSLLSAVPIPDPILERKKVLKVYDPNQHDYSVDKPAVIQNLHEKIRANMGFAHLGDEEEGNA